MASPVEGRNFGIGRGPRVSPCDVAHCIEREKPHEYIQIPTPRRLADGAAGVMTLPASVEPLGARGITTVLTILCTWIALTR